MISFAFVLNDAASWPVLLSWRFVRGFPIIHLLTNPKYSIEASMNCRKISLISHANSKGIIEEIVATSRSLIWTGERAGCRRGVGVVEQSLTCEACVRKCDNLPQLTTHYNSSNTVDIPKLYIITDTHLKSYFNVALGFVSCNSVVTLRPPKCNYFSMSVRAL